MRPDLSRHLMFVESLTGKLLIGKPANILLSICSLLALTHAAGFYKLTRPRMVEDNIINIKGGRWDSETTLEALSSLLTRYRHLLQELTVASYVPNDTLLQGGNLELEDASHSSSRSQAPSMLLLTGPNYSGKSVYMKQVWFVGPIYKLISYSASGCSHCFPRTDWEVNWTSVARSVDDHRC